MRNETPVPSALALIAAGRDHITTAEFARATNRTSQTVRKNYCLTGECYGIRPVKFGNFLIWPVAKIAELLTNGSVECQLAPIEPYSRAPLTNHVLLPPNSRVKASLNTRKQSKR